MGDDIESFISRYECYCKMEYMNESEKAGNLMLAMDPKIYPVIDRELTADEKNDYDTLKRHLLKRFDIYKESGLRRVLFTMLKREVGETHEDYYSRLLDYGNKAFTEETALTIDRMIRDQFMVRNDDKTREHLIGKAPKTSREALSLAIAFQAAQTFTETLKDNTITISATEINENEFRRTDRQTTSKSDSSDKKRNSHKRSSLRDYDHRRKRSNSNEHRSYDNSNRESSSSERDCNSPELERSRNRVSFDKERKFERNYNGNQNFRYANSNRWDNRSNNTQQNRYDNRDQPYNNSPPRRDGKFYRDEFRSGNRYNNEFHDNRRDYSANHVDTKSSLQYVMGIFNRMEVPMLIDTGSAVSIINEEVWKLLNIRGPLDKVPFTVRSVTRHSIKIIGQKDIHFYLKPKAKGASPHHYHFRFFIARGLSKQAIVGADFMKKFDAAITMAGRKLVLHHYRTRSVYNLVSKPSSRRTLEANTLDLFEMKDRISPHKTKEAPLFCRDSTNFNPCCPRPVRTTEQNGVNSKITPTNNKNSMKDQWVHQYLLSKSYLKTGQQGAKATLSAQQEERSSVSESESSDEDIWITRRINRATVLDIPTVTPAVTVA
jgi:hypothetical protein